MIGISSYCLFHEPLADALDRLSGITRLIEIVDEGPHFLENADPLENYDTKFILHAPYHGMNIASLFEPIRRASVEVLTDCFAVAAEAGAPVVLHPGYHAWVEEKEAAGRQFGRSLAGLADAASDLGVAFSFENMGAMDFFNLRTPDDLAILDGCGFTLDTGHANLNGCLPGFLEKPFTHIHIHDNDGKRDTHSAVGEGTIRFGPVLSAMRRNNATAVLEVKTFEGVGKSLQALAGM